MEGILPPRRCLSAALCLAAGIVTAQLAGAGAAEAADAGLYVDKTMSACTDAGTGTSTAPFCTIAPAVSRLQPGMTVFVGDGTYAETVKPPGLGYRLRARHDHRLAGAAPVVGTGATTASWCPRGARHGLVPARLRQHRGGDLGVGR